MSSIRAIGLLSGGLDSALAARLLIEQGIEVIGLHLRSPTACRSDVQEVARDLGVRLVIREKGEEYLRLLRHPRYGYGKNMNPCIDCRLFMFQLGRPYLDEFDACFLFTGEVVGQRPMSQHRNSLLMIDKHSGLRGLILRPLSAQVLPETVPEQRGWVDRSRLLGISGRSRTEQLALAQRFGLKHYQSPGGGCLLTDARFSAKLRDLFDHSPEEQTRVDDVELLRLGRHFRIGDRVKLVLGRDQDENRRLAAFEGPDRWLIEPEGFHGPSALVCGPRDEHSLMQAIRLIVRYSKDLSPAPTVRWREAGGVRTHRVAGLTDPPAALPVAAPEAGPLGPPTVPAEWISAL